MKQITEKELQKKISSPYCMGWQIKQADGTKTRSFKEAADGSILELQFIYGADDCPMAAETWGNEFYKKENGKWYEINREEYCSIEKKMSIS